MTDYSFNFAIQGQKYQVALVVDDAKPSCQKVVGALAALQALGLSESCTISYDALAQLISKKDPNFGVERRIHETALQTLTPTSLSAKLTSVERCITTIDPKNPTAMRQVCLSELMKEYGVSGASIAIFDHGAVCHKGYGTLQDESQLIQAASVSKMVTALTVLSLVKDGVLSLDDDVSLILKDHWDEIDDKKLTNKDNKITVQHLLSHTAGTTVSGFKGRPKGTTCTTDEIIKEVKIDRAPDTNHFQYSGGGTMLLQKIIELKCNNKPFKDVVKERVLTPLGMKESTYSPEDTAKTACGYGPDGKMVPGGYFSYPEHAAGGLWSTPQDLVKVAVEIQNAYEGKGSVITQDLAKKMLTSLTPNTPNGLGVFIDRLSNSVVFEHQGANAGFTCILVANNKGQGACIMTNADQGHALIKDVLRETAKTCNWHDHEELPMCRPLATATELAPVDDKASWNEKYAGVYSHVDKNKKLHTIVVTSEYLQETGYPRYPITHLGKEACLFQEFTPGPPQKFSFKESATGILTLSAFDQEFSRCGAWRHEEHHVVRERQLVANALWEKPEKRASALRYLEAVLIGEKEKLLVQEFKKAIADNDKDKFAMLFTNISRAHVYAIDNGEDLQVLTREFVGTKVPTKQDAQDLQTYMTDTGFQGAVSIASGLTSIQAASQVDSNTAMPIHSLGKVLTGMLLMTMIDQGDIQEADLDKPIQLEPHVLKKLPTHLQEHLKKVTLRQVMLHQAGLGNYLPKYLDAAQKAIDSHSPPPNVQTIEDMLEYAESKTYEIGQERYSNLGSLLFGLSLQYHFNKEKKTHTSFNEILRQRVIQPAGLTSYSEKRPHALPFDPKDPTAHLPATPAGGQWMTAEDLQKFGTWITKQTKLHPLIERNGQEFSCDGVIGHLGALEKTGSSYLRAYLQEGISIAVLSTQERLSGEFAAEKLEAAIRHNLFTKAS
jgi:CubicO group peptidase (beta-lactamase class C family)